MCCCMIKKRTKNFHFTLHKAEGLCLMKRFQETLHKFAIKYIFTQASLLPLENISNLR